MIDTHEILMQEALKASQNDEASTGFPSDYPVTGDLLVTGDDTTGETAPESDGADSRHEKRNQQLSDGSGTHSSLLREYTDHWYVPDSDTYQYAVRTPDGDRRYLNTEEGVANLLARYYE